MKHQRQDVFIRGCRDTIIRTHYPVLRKQQLQIFMKRSLNGHIGNIEV
jgi:hypothetical protein